MAVADVAIAVGAAVGLEGTAAVIGGGAILGAGIGAGYSLLTGDGNVLNSALTGAAIGGAGAGLASAAGAGAAAPTVTGVEAATSATPALQATGPAATGDVFAGLSANAPVDTTLSQSAANSLASSAPATVSTPTSSSLLNTQMPASYAGDAQYAAQDLMQNARDASTWDIGSKTADLGKTALTAKDLLQYGLAGSAAMSLLGGQKQKGLSATNTGTSGPQMIRPYEYSQIKNPKYGQPGEPYFIQSYTAQTPYKAAAGGLMAIGGPVQDMSQNVMGGQQNMYPQSQQEHVNFATPTQMPTSAEIVHSDYDTKTDPYTGDITMARGGIARYADGGMPDPVKPATLVAPVSTYAPAYGSTEAKVNDLYRNVLGRASDAAGQQYWTDKYNTGQLNQDTLKQSFVNSQENKANEAQKAQVADYNKGLAAAANQEYNVAPPPLSTLPGGGQGASSSDLNKIINQYYLQNLGRKGDQPGLDYWTGQVQNQGVSLADVVKGLQTSNEGTVYSDYKNLLGRNPDAEGSAYWNKALQNGMTQAQLADQFKNSPEYLTLHPEIVAARKAETDYQAAPVTQDTFDANAYMKMYPDYATSGFSSPWQHYLATQQIASDMRTAPKLPYQAPNTTTNTNPNNVGGYSYNPITQTYNSGNTTASNTASNTTGAMYTAPDGSLWTSQDAYNRAHPADSGGGKAGGLMPSSLKRAAAGGIMGAYAVGGQTYDLGSYSDGGRLLKGPGDGMSDNIPASIADKQPARLADGEFVVPADVVSHLGNGSTDAGAKRLYSMMDNVRKARTGNKKQGKQIKADKFLPT